MCFNNQTMAGSIICNMEKAFNSVNHVLLLSKQPYYAISGKAELLLVSYIQNRYQRFQIINSCLNSNIVTKWTKIKYGCRRFQFGPIIISVYINDWPKAREHRAIPILFTDVTSILITSPNNIQFQGDLNVVFRQINEWLKGSLLSLNLNKTYFVRILMFSPCIFYF